MTETHLFTMSIAFLIFCNFFIFSAKKKKKQCNLVIKCQIDLFSVFKSMFFKLILSTSGNTSELIQ